MDFTWYLWSIGVPFWALYWSERTVEIKITAIYASCAIYAAILAAIFIMMCFFYFPLFLFFFAGILLSSHSPPVSTPLEPCRVAPYVNLPSLRGNSVATPSTPQHFSTSAAAAAAAFSAFDPALLSAAHQVNEVFVLVFVHLYLCCFLLKFNWILNYLNG